MNLEADLKALIKGKIDSSEATRESYSHDASMFELKPEVVVHPKDEADLSKIVQYVAKHKAEQPGLAITARSGGTDMSGGAIGTSIVLDFTKHFNKIHAVSATQANMQPGVFYRDLEPKTLKYGAYFPSYPASRELCTLGGIVANNSGGEKSLRYGKTEDYVDELTVILRDGKQYVIRPVDRAGLKKKLAQKDLEGEIYRGVFKLVDTHYDKIKQAQPQVSKDSTGYHIWDVWDRETGIFDLNRLIVGSQGTLGLVTDIKLRLVPKAKHSGLIVCYLKDMKKLGQIINSVLEHKPESFESFDDHTLWLSFKFFPYFRKTLGWVGLAKLGLNLIPDALALVKGVPQLVLLIEFTGDTPDEVADKIDAMQADLKPYKLWIPYIEKDETEAKSNKFWIMRRESFNLLRKKVKDKHTAPFMDDLVVPPKHLPKFLPEIRRVINKYQLLATIAGHMGDGNFHIIPLMHIEDPKERAKLQPAMVEITKLVLKYHGSLSGEHNDGMIRGPWLEKMYGAETLDYFKQVKHIFDPDNIFNPHKKTDADWDYSMAHMRTHF